MMFELKALVDEKKLSRVLVALDGLVNNLQIVPVRNAVVKAGKVQEAGEPTSAYEIILQHLKTDRPNTITTAVMRKLCEDAGYSKGAYSNPLKVLVEERILKMGPKRKASQDPQIYLVNASKLPKE